MKIMFLESYGCIKKYSLFHIIFLLIALSGYCDPLGSSFDAYVNKMLRDWDAPGLMISVVKDGKPVFVKGYGTRKLGENWPVDGNTLCPIASNTKAFTAAAA